MNDFYLRQGLQGTWYGFFPQLEQQGVRHGFAARLGGCSEAEFASLNLALHVGDQTAAVLENRRRFAESLQLDAASLVTVNQVHGDAVLAAGAADRL